MKQSATKRERLLDWMRGGDPDDVPIMMGPSFELAASFFRKDERDISWREAIEAAEETGTHNICAVSSPMPFNAVPFVDDINIHDSWDDMTDGGKRLTRTIVTPEGNLREVQEFPKDKGSYHREFFVKEEKDLPAFACFIRKTTEAVTKNPAICDALSAEIEPVIAEVNRAFPLNLWVFCPAVELTSSGYMDQETAIYALYDWQGMFEELMDDHWRMTQVWLELGEKHNIDIYGYAINGLEWLSPSLYERYMIPQARRINDFASSHGKLSWIHTCGKMKDLAASEVYQKIGVDLVESLSSPPTGDILDLAQTRRDIGSDKSTRGGINVEHLYADDREELRRQAEYVLDSTIGYRHILGDTNASYPAYPWENIQTVIDVVKSRRRLFD